MGPFFNQRLGVGLLDPHAALSVDLLQFVLDAGRSTSTSAGRTTSCR